MLLTCAIAIASSAQDSTKWDLRRLVDYAMKNNLNVKQAEVQARIVGLQLKQAKLNQYPSANFGTGIGVQLGRSIDRTTNVYSNTQALYQNIQASSSVDVFNWGRLKHQIGVSQFNAQAALADVEKAANDIALSVCTYYLQALAANEQINIAKLQIDLTNQRLNDTKKRVEAGSLPELNAVQLEAQLASDSSSYYNSKTVYDQNILALKGLLNLDIAAAFDIATPPVEKIPLEPILGLAPEAVYALALNNQPLQKGNALRIKASEKSIAVAKSQMYPSISFGLNLSTNFYNSFKKVDAATFNGYVPGVMGVSDLVNVGGTNYFVQTPSYTVTQSQRKFGELWDGYGTQLSNNFGQGFGFNISVPVFNNGQYRINYEQSKFNLNNTLLNQQKADQQLKLDIYTAYTNAVNAMQKYNASQRQVDAAQKAYDFSVKRYDVGLLGTLDLLITQNTLLTAKVQNLSNRFDYVFRMKLLEFYKGQGLKL